MLRKIFMYTKRTVSLLKYTKIRSDTNLKIIKLDHKNWIVTIKIIT